jgi:hypothetical protein
VFEAEFGEELADGGLHELFERRPLGLAGGLLGWGDPPQTVELLSSADADICQDREGLRNLGVGREQGEVLQ